MAVLERIKKSWNAFWAADNAIDPNYATYEIGPSSSSRADRATPFFSGDRTIVASIYTRLSIDVAALPIRHVHVDEQGRYEDDVDSRLATCFDLQPNIDQAPRHFRQDMALSLFEHGAIAVVPVDTVNDPSADIKFDIESLRVGQIMEWFPRHVRVNLYNEKTGKFQPVTLEKKFVAIVENPLYAVMNGSNSTLQRLQRKLYLLDVVDEASSSGKLDIIIQVPYAIRSETKEKMANDRANQIEAQLKGSTYGIAYTDATEKIIQLNRPAENNLLGQIEYLTKLLYSQLGLTEEVMDGTASPEAMLNYYNRTIEPIVDAFVEAFIRSFLGKIRYDQGERIMYFQNPFKMVPAGDLAEIGDKLVRNEILTKNEFRALMGYKPVKDPGADKLSNPNMPQKDQVQPDKVPPEPDKNPEE